MSHDYGGPKVYMIDKNGQPGTSFWQILLTTIWHHLKKFFQAIYIKMFIFRFDKMNTIKKNMFTVKRQPHAIHWEGSYIFKRYVWVK